MVGSLTNKIAEIVGMEGVEGCKGVWRGTEGAEEGRGHGGA